MSHTEALREEILKQLSTVIDPETGVDVVRMRLIEDLHVDESGFVSYKFRPSSPLCPIVIPLSLMIQKAVAEVPGVTNQDLEIVGYFQAEEITAMLKKEFGGSPIYRNKPENSDDAR